MLLDAIIKNMKKRLVADDHVKAISTEQENVLELFNLLDQNTWNLEESVVPWVAVSLLHLLALCCNCSHPIKAITGCSRK